MRICLVRCPSPFLIDDRAFPPLGLMSVGAGLRQQGHFVKLWDGPIDDVPLDFDGYGFGPTTPEYPTAVKTMERLRYCEQHPRIVLGGAHAKLNREACLKDGWDCVVAGDGEYAAHEAFTGEAEFIQPPALPLDQYPFPDRSLIDLSSYHFALHGRLATTMMSARGCPFHCGFCCKNETKVRLRSAASMIEEIKTIQALGFTAIAFPEDLFIVSRARTEAVCKYLKTQNVIWRCLVRADLVVRYGQDFLKTLAEAGCTNVGIGIESGSDKILKVINKCEDRATMMQAVKMLKAAGLFVKGFFIVGLPGENEETLADTERFLEEVQLDDLDLTIFTPYPGSPIWEHREQYDISWSGSPLEYNYFKGKPGDYRGTVSTSALTTERLLEAQKQLEGKYKRWNQ